MLEKDYSFLKILQNVSFFQGMAWLSARVVQHAVQRVWNKGWAPGQKDNTGTIILEELRS